MPQPITPGGLPNSPDIDPKTLDQRVRAISSASQAHSLAMSLQQDHDKRNLANAQIWKQYNCEPPVDQARRVNTAQAWRSNFNSGFLSSVIDKQLPTFVTTIMNMRRFTSARLDSRMFPDRAEVKSDIFAEELTKTLRAWNGLRDFISLIANENYILGYCAAGYLDPFDWRPRHFRQEHALFPAETGQRADDLQFWVICQSWKVHELFDRIKDREVAEAAGWEVDNVVKVINQAMPVQPGQKFGRVDPRAYADMVRDGSLFYSYSTGAKVVESFHVFVRETDTGNVTQWTVEASSGLALMTREDNYEMPRHAVTLFSLEIGNGHLHGSRGAGKRLYNLALEIEKGRNKVMDAIQLATLMLLKGDTTAKQKLATSVVGPFMVVDKSIEVAQIPLQANPEALIALENRLISQAEQTAGSVVPAQLAAQNSNTTDKTATEATIDQNNAEQIKQGVLFRWFSQFAEVFTEIQRRLCDPNTTDPEAMDFQRRLIEAGLSAEEIVYLGSQPAFEGSDVTQLGLTGMVPFLSQLTQDPMVDPLEVRRLLLTQTLGSQIAERLLKKADDAVKAAAQAPQAPQGLPPGMPPGGEAPPPAAAPGGEPGAVV